jgi:hypothetical protein
MKRALRCVAPVVALVASLAAGPAAAGGTTIYKCVARGMTSYQSMPCGSDQAEVRVARFAGVPQAEPSVAPAAAGTRTQAGPWPRRPIALGMTDDEVLNMPEWGRPARIARTRLARGWQEVWSYRDAWGAERQLYFTNARLADIVDVAHDQVALTTH